MVAGQDYKLLPNGKILLRRINEDAWYTPDPSIARDVKRLAAAKAAERS